MRGPIFHQDFPFSLFRIHSSSFSFNIFLRFLKNLFWAATLADPYKTFKANTFIKAAEAIQQFLVRVGGDPYFHP